ncbi:5-oxoprolinase subunit B family protein [Anianabacter salinae]|uniref:5-oxoprolinase subunit B family protein n=1 Tax=Anianabacter salinae TaxID=2851023 RepID=UPI00225E1C15|nr:carboxyltransferase domain-containing protein [Anianabacter salinae]MBV0912367.1 allophanate hydrolase subunit 1 [Anianabacter salinae]
MRSATLRPLGPDGWLVSFATAFEDAANRAALAFRAAIDAEGWPEVSETSSSLVSAFVRFDPLARGAETLEDRLQNLLSSRDWSAADLPPGRRLWRLPVVWGGDLAPGLAEAAEAAGLSEEDAAAALSQARLRVLTLGFAPGQPYLGTLPPAFDLPRQTRLTPRVPEGALVLAVRQLTLFARPGQTGWRHVGQTAFRVFRPEAEDPFPLSAGDEIAFDPVSPDALGEIRRADSTGNGGARVEEIA